MLGQTFLTITFSDKVGRFFLMGCYEEKEFFTFRFYGKKQNFISSKINSWLFGEIDKKYYRD
ncbi:MAG: hypothetical protein KAQ62_16445 [Cyclobacteriaceae bacterium]|nr:hypothetical protein [Cyclobacteriaceae bacterium]MCK5370153.1 hypothetical protein [Cyclobacteriaceae bacterium]MCK5703895.1 hypothetical protein [Cyclobacteriaceae bacterium]